MSSARSPAVAGMFYPSEPGALRDEVDRLLGQVQQVGGGDVPRALIAPHAGYAYSGPVAATAFRRIAGAGGRFARVVVIGPSHFVTFGGIAVPRGAGAFRTPLGEVPVDREAVATLARLSGVVVADEPQLPPCRTHSAFRRRQPEARVDRARGARDVAASAVKRRTILALHDLLDRAAGCRRRWSAASPLTPA